MTCLDYLWLYPTWIEDDWYSRVKPRAFGLGVQPLNEIATKEKRKEDSISSIGGIGFFLSDSD